MTNSYMKNIEETTKLIEKLEDKTRFEISKKYPFDNTNPSRSEFYSALVGSIRCMEEADDAGSVDILMGNWQEWTQKWPKIFDKYGGI